MGTHKRKQHTPPTHSPPGDEKVLLLRSLLNKQTPPSLPLTRPCYPKDKIGDQATATTEKQNLYERKLKGTLPLPPSRLTYHCLQGQHPITALGGATALGAVPAFSFLSTLPSMGMRQLTRQPGALKRRHQGRE